MTAMDKLLRGLDRWCYRRPVFYPVLLLTPGAVLFLVFYLYPLLYVSYLSLLDVDLSRQMPARFVALDNYVLLLSDAFTWRVVLQTIVFVAGSVGLAFVGSLAVSVVLNWNFRGSPLATLAQAVLLVPYALPGIVVGLIWTWMFDGQVGILNYMLVRLRVIAEFQPWLLRGDTALLAVIVARVWHVMAWMSLFLLAGLQAIPSTIIEAALLDRASPWRCFLHVVVPYLRGMMAVVLVLQTVWALHAFDIIYAMTGGGPVYETTVLNLYSYKATFEYLRFSQGSAIGIVLILMTIPMITLYLRSVGRRNV